MAALLLHAHVKGGIPDTLSFIIHNAKNVWGTKNDESECQCFWKCLGSAGHWTISSWDIQGVSLGWSCSGKQEEQEWEMSTTSWAQIQLLLHQTRAGIHAYYSWRGIFLQEPVWVFEASPGPLQWSEAVTHSSMSWSISPCVLTLPVIISLNVLCFLCQVIWAITPPLPPPGSFLTTNSPGGYLSSLWTPSVPPSWHPPDLL